MTDADEREWQAQELARLSECLGLDLAREDVLARRYRLLSRALRQPLPDALPIDFAERVAARVPAPPAMWVSASSRFDSIVLAVLGSTLVLSAVLVLARGGQNWLPGIRATLEAANPNHLRWPLAFVGCLGLSAILWQWQSRAT